MQLLQPCVRSVGAAREPGPRQQVYAAVKQAWRGHALIAAATTAAQNSNVSGAAALNEAPEKGQPPRIQSVVPGKLLRVAEQSKTGSVAGAIAKSFGEGTSKVLVQAVGANAVYNAVKAVAIARKMVTSNLSMDIAMQPALAPNNNKDDIRERHTIRLYLYIVPLTNRSAGTSARDLKVGRETEPVKLAGAIATALESGDSCRTLASGAVSSYRATRAVSVARRLLIRKQPNNVVGTTTADQEAAATSLSSSEQRTLEQPASTQSAERSSAGMAESSGVDLMVFPHWVTQPQEKGGEVHLLAYTLEKCILGSLEKATEAKMGIQAAPDATDDVRVAPKST